MPDRLPGLPPEVGAVFAGVRAILHAGDVSAARVLAELGEIAPVHAVAGNTDALRLRLPLDRVLEFDGVRIGLTHGHGGWLQYVWQKASALTVGYDLMRYVRMARARFGAVDAVVFGHTHRPVNLRHAGALMFNPGSLGPDYYPPEGGPTLGLLRVARGRVRGEIVRL